VQRRIVLLNYTDVSEAHTTLMMDAVRISETPVYFNDIRSLLRARNKVLQPYETRGTVILLYISNLRIF
jgi:hypothetical protein